jgi:hypothetical protein
LGILGALTTPDPRRRTFSGYTSAAMHPDDDNFDPNDRPAPAPEHEMALAARALEYTRKFAVPSEPLAAYVFAADSLLGEAVADRIPWEHEGPHPRVVTENGRLRVGWAPLATIAAAIESYSSDDATALRKFPASDVGVWTVVHVRTAVTIARVERNELLTMEVEKHRETIPPEPAGDPYDLPPAPRAYPTFRTGCRYTAAGTHDGLGPRYVTFDDKGRLELVAQTCSRCDRNSLVA